MDDIQSRIAVGDVPLAGKDSHGAPIDDQLVSAGKTLNDHDVRFALGVAEPVFLEGHLIQP
jgi:hypothetical protein